METQSERTRLDECFEEAHAILAANGVTLEMAMAKLLELRENSGWGFRWGKIRRENFMKTQPLILWAALLPGLLAAGPTLAAPKSGGEVTIISTGDRQTPGYRVTVQPGGALSSALTPRGRHTPIRRSDTLIAANRVRLFADLAKAGPLSGLPTGTITSQGPRGVRGRSGRRGFQQQQNLPPGTASRQAPSAYPQIFVRYGGRQSPNLRQANSEPGRVLYQDVKQILQVLRLPIPDQP